MLNNLAEIELKFDKLRELSGRLAAYESSGFKKTLENFEATLEQSKGVKQSKPAMTTLTRTLDSAITQVESWINSEQRELKLSDQHLKELSAKLLRTKELLTIKKVSPQASETEQKHANDPIENSRSAPDEAAASVSDFTAIVPHAYGLKTDVENEADRTLLIGQLGAIEVKLLQASRTLKETETSALKNSNRVKNIRGEISKLTPGTQAMEAAMLKLEGIVDEIQPILEIIPEAPKTPVDLDENGSFYGSAYLEAIKAGEGVTSFYKKAKETSDSHEVSVLKTENTGLKTQLKTAQTEIKSLSTKTTELGKSLSQEREAGTKLITEVTALKDSLKAEQDRTEALAAENAHLYAAVEANQNLAKEFAAQMKELDAELEDLTLTKAKDDETSEFFLRKQVQVLADNKRLQENLDEEGKRYIARETELLGEIEKVKSETAEATAQIAQHQYAYSTLESKLTQSREDLAEAEKGRKSALATINEYELEYPEALAEAEEKVQKAEAALAKNEAELEELKSTLSEAKTKIAALSERNAILEKETLYEHFKTEATEKIVECDQLRKQIAKQKVESKAEINSLCDEINKLQKRLSENNAIDRHNDSQHLKIEALERKVKRLQGLRVLDARTMTRDGRITPDAVMLQQAEDQVKGLSNANVALQAQLAAANARIQALEQSHATEVAPAQTPIAQEIDEPVKSQKLDATDGILIGTGVAGTALCLAAAVVTAIGLFAAWPLAVAGVVIGLGGYLVWNHLKNSKHEDETHEINHPASQPREALVVKPAITKLSQSKHEDGIAGEVVEHKEAQSGFVQKTALAVKSTLEKTVFIPSQDLEKA